MIYRVYVRTADKAGLWIGVRLWEILHGQQRSLRGIDKAFSVGQEHNENRKARFSKNVVRSYDESK